MARITSKLQVTIPKAVADRYSLRPGDEVEFVPSGDGIRVVTERHPDFPLAERLRMFDQATTRQKKRERLSPQPAGTKATGRGWTREELYERARPR